MNIFLRCTHAHLVIMNACWQMRPLQISQLIISRLLSQLMGNYVFCLGAISHPSDTSIDTPGCRGHWIIPGEKYTTRLPSSTLGVNFKVKQSLRNLLARCLFWSSNYLHSWQVNWKIDRDPIQLWVGVETSGSKETSKDTKPRGIL